MFTAGFLARARTAASERTGPLRRRLRHAPRAAADLAPERFRLVEHDRVPARGADVFERLRAATNALYPERSRRVAVPLPAYEQAALLLEGEGGAVREVPDVARRHGDGTALLARLFPHVVGAGYDAAQVARDAALNPGVAFRAGDATDPGLFAPRSFDAIVSIHSMEHLEDDRAFLRACRTWLRAGGRFVLGVPLVMERPFAGIDTPLGEDHVREHRPSALLELVREEGFDVLAAFGVARGLYLDLERARDAALLLLAPR